MKKRWMAAIGILLILAFIALLLVNRTIPNHPFFEQFSEYPLIFAHADDTGSGLWPGNTMIHLKKSAAMGVDVLEFDIHLTKDGTLILMHDDTVDRTTNGSGRIADLELNKIQALEVGFNWTKDNGESFPYRGQGLQAPTLEAVFREFSDYPMNIEIKDTGTAAVNPLCKLIKEFDKQNHILVASSNDEAMAAFRDSCPEVATSGSSSEVRNFVIMNFLMLSKILPIEYEAFQVPEESSGIPVTIPHFVNSANGRNAQVHVWTVNDPQDMQKFIDMGVQGIMTD